MNEKSKTKYEVYETPELEVIEVETEQNVLGGSMDDVSPEPW